MTANQANISSVPSFDDLPRRVDRRTAAKLITHYFFEVSPRTLEAWPIKWVHVNGKAIGETKDFFHVAELKLNAATPMRGGRRSPNDAKLERRKC